MRTLVLLYVNNSDLTVVERCCVTKDHYVPIFYNLVESKVHWFQMFAFHCIIRYLSSYIFSVQRHMRFVFDRQINVSPFEVGEFGFGLDE